LHPTTRLAAVVQLYVVVAAVVVAEVAEDEGGVRRANRTSGQALSVAMIINSQRSNCSSTVAPPSWCHFTLQLPTAISVAIRTNCSAYDNRKNID